jgi:hypothetical protein
MGPADGSIIPVIITAHIAHSKKRCGASHTAVIIHALAPVMGPYISRDKTMIQARQTRGTRTRNAVTDHARTDMGVKLYDRG